jgi:hypothetical protein
METIESTGNARGKKKKKEPEGKNYPDLKGRSTRHFEKGRKKSRETKARKQPELSF